MVYKDHVSVTRSSKRVLTNNFREKTKTMAFEAKYPVRTKIVMNNSTLEQMSRLKYLGCEVNCECELIHKQDKDV